MEFLTLEKYVFEDFQTVNNYGIGNELWWTSIHSLCFKFLKNMSVNFSDFNV